MSFGEATSTYTGSKLSAELFRNWFGNFCEGFPKDSRIWFAYEHFANFELPADFRFDEINSDKFEKSREVFSAAISLCILPVGIHQGRNIQISYEFYYPMSAARQLGMGQLPIGLYFADKIQSKGEITSALMMDRLLNIPRPSLGSIENIELALLRSTTFDRWWAEWKKHIFYQSASMYLTDMFPDMVPQVSTLPFIKFFIVSRCLLILHHFSSLFVDHRIFTSTCQPKWRRHQLCCGACTKWWWISSFSHRLQCSQVFFSTTWPNSWADSLWSWQKEKSQAIGCWSISCKEEGTKEAKNCSSRWFANYWSICGEVLRWRRNWRGRRRLSCRHKWSKRANAANRCPCSSREQTPTHPARQPRVCTSLKFNFFRIPYVDSNLNFYL